MTHEGSLVFLSCSGASEAKPSADGAAKTYRLQKTSTKSDSRGRKAYEKGQQHPRLAPFSFFHRARRCLSFRQGEKKDRGAHEAGRMSERKKDLSTCLKYPPVTALA